MGALVWVMMGIAIWHFTIFLPDHFWSGIVGAFLGAVVGSVLFGLIVHGFSVPGNDEMSVVTALEGLPGALIGMGITYVIGLRQDRAAGYA